MNRRNLLKTGLAAGAALTLPGRLAAQPMAGSARDRKLFALAKEQLDKAGDVVWMRDVVGIADFGLRSSEERFHFVNLDRQEVTSYLVSHGTGSDPEHDGWLNRFSNVHGSNATSRGAYITWEWYTGRYGTSVRLGGLDETNDNAFPRAIVMHPAAYAERSHLERWGRLGRSNGCFALGEDDFNTALLALSGGRILYAGDMGWAEDGGTVARPGEAPVPAEDDPVERFLETLKPDDPTTAQRYNPGLF